MNDRPEEPFTKLVMPFGITEQDVLEFAEENDFELVRTTEEDEARMMPRTLTFKHRDLDAYFQLVHNFKLDVYFMRATGTDRNEVAEKITSFYNVVDLDEVRRLLESDLDDNRSLAMAYLAELAPRTASPDLVALFQRGASDDSTDVRESTFLGMGFVLWPELLPIVDEARKHEKDAYLREQLNRRHADLSKPKREG